jgi:hypothetical protein
MALTCLQLIQQVCLRLSIASPNVAITSTDTQILQLLALSNEEGRELVSLYDWSVLQTESTFVTVAAQLQGTVESIAPNYKFILNDIVWNRNTRLPIYGSRSSQEWQQAVAMQFTSPYSQYRIRGGNFYLFPIPEPNQTCSLEYVSKNWVNKASNSSMTNFWSSDNDTCIFDDDIMMAGIMWRWRAEKGLHYGEKKEIYDALVADATDRDATKQILTTHGRHYDLEPGIFIPSGSWSV